MSLKERNLNKIVQCFVAKENLTLNDIQIVLNIKERNSKNYIRYLKEYGFEVNCNDGVYSLGSINEVQPPIIDNEALREMQILSIVGANDGKLHRKGLVNKVKDGFCDEEVVSEKTILRAIKKCEDKKIIKKEDNKYRLLVTSNNLYEISYQNIYSFIDKCDVYNTSIPFPIEVNELKEKISIQCDYTGWDYSIHSLGRKYDRNILKEFFKKIDKYDYKNKKLMISYESKVGRLVSLIDIGTFYYSWEKDKVYIVGKKENDLILINVETIFEIKETEQTNYSFGDSEIIKKVKLMFQASLSGPYYVKVEFKNIFNIKSKLERLCKSRDKSVLIDMGDTLIYQDEIYGIYDFANYLRRFGYSCKVTEPNELKNIMKNTYERILRNYGVN